MTVLPLHARALIVVTLGLASATLVASPALAADGDGGTLSIEKTVDQEFVNAGSSVVYTLTIHNSGPLAAENVTVTDSLPDALEATNADHGGSELPGNRIEWSIASIESGSTLTLTVDALVLGGFDNTTQTNSFGVAADAAFAVVPVDPCESDATQACVSIAIQPRAEAVEAPDPTLANTGSDLATTPIAFAGGALLVALGVLLARRRLTT